MNFFAAAAENNLLLVINFTFNEDRFYLIFLIFLRSFKSAPIYFQFSRFY